MESDEKSASSTFSRISHKFGLHKSNNEKVISTPLKKHTSGRQNSQLCIKLVKTDKGQGISPDRKRSKIQFLERSSLKQPPAETKMSLEEEKLVDTEVPELLWKGPITPAQVSEDQFVSKNLSETEKRRLFSSYYKFEKFDPIHSIFAFQNGRPKTTKRSSKAKISNGKNRSQRCLLQHTPASRSTEVCKVSVERESIPVHMSLF